MWWYLNLHPRTLILPVHSTLPNRTSLNVNLGTPLITVYLVLVIYHEIIANFHSSKECWPFFRIRQYGCSPNLDVFILTHILTDWSTLGKNSVLRFDRRMPPIKFAHTNDAFKSIAISMAVDAILVVPQDLHFQM